MCGINSISLRWGWKLELVLEISIDDGVKQGDISAPTLFTINFAAVFLEAFFEIPDGIYIRYRTAGKVYNIRRLLAHTKVSSLLRELLYADYYDIVTHSEDERQRVLWTVSRIACQASFFKKSIWKRPFSFTIHCLDCPT